MISLHTLYKASRTYVRESAINGTDMSVEDCLTAVETETGLTATFLQYEILKEYMVHDRAKYAPYYNLGALDA